MCVSVSVCVRVRVCVTHSHKSYDKSGIKKDEFSMHCCRLVVD